MKLPKEYFKILYWRERHAETLNAKGYVLTQTDLISDLEALELPEFAVFEVPIGEIGRRTGLVLSGGGASEAVSASRKARKAEAEEKPNIRRVGSVREIIG